MSMKENNGNIRAFHPGYYVNEIIENSNITQEEFAAKSGISTETIRKFVKGEIKISDDLAQQLSLMMGTSIDVWLNLQSEYDKKMLERKQVESNEVPKW